MDRNVRITALDALAGMAALTPPTRFELRYGLDLQEEHPRGLPPPPGPMVLGKPSKPQPPSNRKALLLEKALRRQARWSR